NTYGTGAKVWVKAGQEIFLEAYTQRGYLSSVDPVLTIGIGQKERIDEVSVHWSDGTVTMLKDVAPNQLLVIEAASDEVRPMEKGVSSDTVLTESTITSGLDFTHRENTFVDYKVQRLRFYQLSRVGAMLSAGDVTNDREDDVFF